MAEGRRKLGPREDRVRRQEAGRLVLARLHVSQGFCARRAIYLPLHRIFVNKLAMGKEPTRIASVPRNVSYRVRTTPFDTLFQTADGPRIPRR
jgi:hypothetical protein